MQKVVTINLHGNAYQLDESAFAALREYLDHAEARLAGNPDRAEILLDLEHAIAEKCSRFLGPHKTVVSAAEMSQVITEMGPVEATEPQADDTGAAKAAPADAPQADRRERPGPKRLYRIREGAMWAGVCTGLAAYIHMDVVFVRIAFAVATAVTFGWALLGYWILSVIIPVAETADERASAHGQSPFNAQDVIDDARRAAETLRNSAHFSRREWKRQMREQRRQWRSHAYAWRSQVAGAAYATRTAAEASTGYVAPALAGAMLPLFGLISFACFIVMVLAILSLVNTGAIYGWPLPAGVPGWAGILMLMVLFQIITSPIRAAARASRYAWRSHFGWFVVWDGIFAIAMMVIPLWLILRHMPPVHDVRDFMHYLPTAISGAAQEVAGWFQMLVEKLRA